MSHLRASDCALASAQVDVFFVNANFQQGSSRAKDDLGADGDEAAAVVAVLPLHRPSTVVVIDSINDTSPASERRRISITVVGAVSSSSPPPTPLSSSSSSAQVLTPS